MRIIFVLHGHECGGAEKHALMLMEGVKSEGHEVAFAGPMDSWLAENARAAGIPCIHVPMHGFYDAYSLYLLIKAAKGFKADLLHGHLGRGSHYAGLASQLLKIPMIATAHSTNTHKHFKRANNIIAVSSAVREQLVDKGYSRERITLIHNGVPDPAVGGADRSAIRSQLGLADREIALCMVARFIPDKGHELAVTALADLKQANVLLFLIGKAEGKCYQAVRRQVRDLGLERQIRFLGQRENVNELLRGMDIYLAPSRREAFPLSILEACGAGLPMIATRVGGIPEIISDRENGLLFDSNDTASLVGLLNELLASPDYRGTLSERARQNFTVNLSIKKMLDSCIELYRSELNSRSRTS